MLRCGNLPHLLNSVAPIFDSSAQVDDSQIKQCHWKIPLEIALSWII